MDFQQLIDNINPTIYASLKRALELGKWPDGRALTAEQRELCMTAVIAYDLKVHDEKQRVGYIDRGSKAEGETCGGHGAADTVQAIKWAE